MAPLSAFHSKPIAPTLSQKITTEIKLKLMSSSRTRDACLSLEDPVEVEVPCSPEAVPRRQVPVPRGQEPVPRRQVEVPR